MVGWRPTTLKYHPTMNVNLFQTIQRRTLRAARSMMPVPEGVEGKNLANLIRGKSEKVRDHLFTAYMRDQRTIRDDRWKLFYRKGDDRLALYDLKNDLGEKTNLEELEYDLKNDPHELNDLAKRPEHAERIAELKVALAKARTEYGDTDEAVARLMRSRGGGRSTGRLGGRTGGRPSGRLGGGRVVRSPSCRALMRLLWPSAWPRDSWRTPRPRTAWPSASLNRHGSVFT